jgi:hypothetical protein
MGWTSTGVKHWRLVTVFETVLTARMFDVMITGAQPHDAALNVI